MQEGEEVEDFSFGEVPRRGHSPCHPRTPRKTPRTRGALFLAVRIPTRSSATIVSPLLPRRATSSPPSLISGEERHDPSPSPAHSPSSPPYHRGAHPHLHVPRRRWWQCFLAAEQQQSGSSEPDGVELGELERGEACFDHSIRILPHCPGTFLFAAPCPVVSVPGIRTPRGVAGEAFDWFSQGEEVTPGGSRGCILTFFLFCLVGRFPKLPSGGLDGRRRAREGRRDRGSTLLLPLMILTLFIRQDALYAVLPSPRDSLMISLCSALNVGGDSTE